MTSPAQKPILISGAGLASLLFARSLLRSSIPFLIFERDQSLSFRAQGYRLRLSSEGLDAIEEVLGPDAFRGFWDRCGKTSGRKAKGFGNIDATTGEDMVEELPANDLPKVSLTAREGKTIGISRGDMRAWFLQGCEPFVRWGRQVVGYTATDDGVRAVFPDGSMSVVGELLVGADGLSSRVAKHVSHGRLKTYDTGARGIHGQAPTTAFRALGEGVWRLVDSSRPGGNVWCITNVRPGDMDDPNLQFGWTMGGAGGVIQPPNDDFAIIGKPAADIAKSLTAHWHPRLTPLFEQMDEAEAAFWKITCSTPSGVPDWPTHPRVTVIGDAAHSMTPAAGLGANTAVRDSALLGRLLGAAGGWNERVTAAYEKEMREYASEAVGISYAFAAAQMGISIDEQTTPTV